MPSAQEQYDEAMFDYTQGNYDACIEKLQALIAADSNHFDAQLSLGMAYYRKGDFAAAIAEGHKAEKMRPKEQLVHTNLSLFYMKAGNKVTAEHHGLQARISGWRENMTPPTAGVATDSELQMAQEKPAPVKLPTKFPDMSWKKKARAGDGSKPEDKP